MASGFYVTGAKEMIDNTIDIDNDTLKVMLVTTAYTFDPDHDVIDNGANNATDPSFNELTVSGYVGGFGGAGRKGAGTIVVLANKTDNRVDIGLAADLTWTALASGETIGGAILVKEITDDTASRLIAFFDVTDTPTNGGDVVLDFTVAASGGNLRLNV